MNKFTYTTAALKYLREHGKLTGYNKVIDNKNCFVGMINGSETILAVYN